MKSSFVCHLKENHPEFDSSKLGEMISEQLLSPFQVKISEKQIQKIRDEIQNYWQLRQWGVKHLATEYDTLSLRRPDNFSACMSYDFHINTDGQPELIEINTNASFLALGLELYSLLNLPNIANTNFNETSLIEMFKEEMRLSNARGSRLAIIDETPDQQRLHIEFLVYKSLFKKYGIECEILDILKENEFSNFDFIYNRHTDFYLQDEKSALLRKLFNENRLQLSPNSYEYFLLADKKRLLDWNLQSDVARPESLLKIYDMGQADKEAVWSERKSLFFKPK